MPGGPKLSRKKEAAVAALLTEKTLADAAAKAGVGERTLRGWLKEDAGFREAYREARQQVQERTLARLLEASGKAIDALEECVGADEKASDRIRAALGILEHAHKGLEQSDVLGRLEALERKAEQRGKRP